MSHNFHTQEKINDSFNKVIQNYLLQLVLVAVLSEIIVLDRNLAVLLNRTQLVLQSHPYSLLLKQALQNRPDSLHQEVVACLLYAYL